VINWVFSCYIGCFSIFSSNFIDCESGVTICNHFRIRRPAHATTSSTRSFHSPYAISYRYSIETKSVSPAVFEILGIKHNAVTTFAFLGNVTSSVTWPFDSPCPIYDMCSIAEKSVSPAFWDTGHKTFWGHDLDLQGYLTSSQIDIFTGAPLSPSMYFHPFPRYWALSIIGFTPLNFLDRVTSSVTWPFDSQVAIFYRCYIVTKCVSPAFFERMGIKHNEVTTLTFLGHVTSLVMWPIYSQVAISYRWSIVTKFLSPAIFEILRSKHIEGHDDLSGSRDHLISR